MAWSNRLDEWFELQRASMTQADHCKNTAIRSWLFRMQTAVPEMTMCPKELIRQLSNFTDRNCLVPGTYAAIAFSTANFRKRCQIRSALPQGWDQAWESSKIQMGTPSWKMVDQASAAFDYLILKQRGLLDEHWWSGVENLEGNKLLSRKNFG